MESEDSKAIAQEPDALGRVLAAGLKDTTDIARALGISQRSVQRWAALGPARRPPSRYKEARLLELAAVLEQANARLPGGSAAAGLWLRAPSEQLDWSAPLDFISQGRYRQVIAILPTTPR
jgi:uncharacterized protein (DUF2384 family)